MEVWRSGNNENEDHQKIAFIPKFPNLQLSHSFSLHFALSLSLSSQSLLSFAAIAGGGGYSNLMESHKRNERNQRKVELVV